MLCSMEDEPAYLFMQYKNTDACFDFYCECGAHCHYDGYFAYKVKCPHCGVVWSLPSVLPVRRSSEVDGFDSEFTGVACGYSPVNWGSEPVELEPDEDLLEDAIRD